MWMAEVVDVVAFMIVVVCDWLVVLVVDCCVLCVGSTDLLAVPCLANLC